MKKAINLKAIDLIFSLVFGVSIGTFVGGETNSFPLGFASGMFVTSVFGILCVLGNKLDKILDILENESGLKK